jgi:hypothetical protein
LPQLVDQEIEDNEPGRVGLDESLNPAFGRMHSRQQLVE